MRVSVCMAVYNGEKYLKEQLDTILYQLSADDELLIVNDDSQDRSLAIVESLADTRIRIHTNERNLGVIRSFEKALTMSTGDIIFLSDQDDVWFPTKVSRVQQEFERTGCAAVVADGIIIDGSGRQVHDSFFAFRNSGAGFLKNLYKNTYLGCAMAIHKRAKSWILPFPSSIPMHDEWIGLTCDFLDCVAFLQEPLFGYRRHGNNVSPTTRYPWGIALRKRIGLVRAIAGKPLAVKYRQLKRRLLQAN